MGSYPGQPPVALTGHTIIEAEQPSLTSHPPQDSTFLSLDVTTGLASRQGQRLRSIHEVRRVK